MALNLFWLLLVFTFKFDSLRRSFFESDSVERSEVVKVFEVAHPEGLLALFALVNSSLSLYDLYLLI